MLTVNDEPLPFEPGLTVRDLLTRLGYESRLIAVWVDGTLVPRGAYGTTPVPDGGHVQIVHIIAGG